MPDESVVGVETKQIQIIPEDSIDMIKKIALSHKPDGTLNYRYGPALVFLLNTGLREGDAYGKIRLKLDKPSKYKGLG